MQRTEATPARTARKPRGKTVAAQKPASAYVPLSAEEQIDRNIENMKRIARGDKKSVVDFLKRAGILNEAGKLPAMS